MSKSNTLIFKRSLLALAVASLSACSTPAPVADFELKQIGATIVTASRNTADLSKRTWDRTSYLLGFTEGKKQTTDRLLMDEVDLALMEEDAILPDDVTTRPIIIEQATATRLNDADSDLNAQPVAIIITDPDTQDLAQLADDEAPVFISEDLIHEVSASETLWDIAKLTTGDANNWHSIADVNNLAPNAAVFPGQQLVIPGDLVKSDYDLPSDGTQDTELATSIVVVEPANADVTSPDTELAAALPDSDTQSDAPTIAVATNENSEAFKLNPGETLWDFARRTTGDATNWQAIAEQNNFSQTQAAVVHAGQTIYVPEALVKTETAFLQGSALPQPDTTEQLSATALKDTATKVQNQASTVAESALPETSQKPLLNDDAVAELSLDNAAGTEDSALSLEPSTLPKAVNESVPEAVDTVGALLADASKTPAAPAPQPIKIVEAAYKPDSEMPALSVKPVTEDASTDSAAIPQEIMVSGTYYPKAVYNDADFSSSLLMRVSPGTTLRVANAVGTWFEVETEKGRGFVHQRDIK